MKLHSAIAKALYSSGVRTVFGLMGEANMHIINDLIVVHDVKYVSVVREDGAVLAADAYARVTGKLGIATVTHGPALTNTVTALTEAARNRTSMLLIAGDTAPDDFGNLQNINQEDVVRLTGAGFANVASSASALRTVHGAIRRAVAERRPIVLNVPRHLQEVDVEYSVSNAIEPTLKGIRPDVNSLDRALGAIASAARPLILAGKGASDREARQALLQLAVRLGAPVATTLSAKGAFAGSPLDVGIFGGLSSPRAGAVISRSDCLVVFGASLNEYTTEHGLLVEGKRIIQCDLDPTQIGRWVPVDVAVIGDAASVALEASEWIDQLDVGARPVWCAELFQSEEDPRAEFEDRSDDDSVDMRTCAIRVNEIFPRDRILVTDLGRFFMPVARYLEVPEPAAFVCPLNFGSIGLALASAVGAATGNPDRPVLAAVGDGGLMSSIAEFSTAVRYSLNVTLLVFNDGGYGVEYHNFLQRGLDPAPTLFDWPDFAAVARALGGEGFTVANLGHLHELESVLHERTGPLLIDVRVDPAVRIGFHD